MRPEDVIVVRATGGSPASVPIDVALQALDSELEASGAQARRMLNGRRQPTRYFTIDLRQSLLDALPKVTPLAG